MTHDQIHQVKERVREWAKKLCPCEAPCDSYGVCENCCEVSLIMAGASKALNMLYESETGVPGGLEHGK